MSWLITASYTPPFPDSPSDEDEWTDPNTGITWVFSTTTFESTVFEPNVYATGGWSPLVAA